MLKIDVKGLKELQADLKDLGERRIKKTTAIALTETAVSLKENLHKEMKSRFHMPTRWTMNSLFTKSATVNDQSAYVWFKDDRAVSKGTPAVKYLWPEVHGGPRNLKRYEKALQYFGVLPGGYYTVPSKYLKKGPEIDNNGNIKTGFITEILTGVRALRSMADTKFLNHKTGEMEYGAYQLRKKTTANFFVVKVKHGGLVPGIWQRVPSERGKYNGPIAMQRGKTKGEHYYEGVGRLNSSLILARGVRPILIFVKQPRYTQRLPFYDIAQRFVDIEFPKIWHRLANETLAYWKGRKG